MKIYIYGLYDPIAPERMRYVGATANLDRRMSTHIQGKDAQTKPLFEELRKLGRPICFKILEVTDELNKSAIESKWINSFSEVDLLNKRVSEVFDFRVSPIVTMADMEIKYLNWTIEHFGGNKIAACRALGISRQKVYNMLRNIET